MTANIEVKNNSYKYLLYMAITIAAATYAAASSDITLSMASAMVGGAFFAVVCLCKFGAFTLIPMMLIPPVAVYLITNDLILSLMSLSFLPVGVTVLYGMNKGLTRSQTIVRTTAVLVVFYILVYASLIVKIFGAFNTATVGQYLDLNFDLVREYMSEMEQTYTANGVKMDAYFTESLEAAIMAFRLSVLGYVIAISAIVAYVSTAIAKKTAKAENVYPDELGEWKFVLSKTGALVFIFAYFAQTIYSADTEGLYFPFAINTLCVSLYPGIIYMGVTKLVKKFCSGVGIGRIITLIIAIVIFGASAALLLIIIGLYATLTYKSSGPLETKKK